MVELEQYKFTVNQYKEPMKELGLSLSLSHKHEQIKELERQVNELKPVEKSQEEIDLENRIAALKESEKQVAMREQKVAKMEMLSEKACLSPFYFTRVFTKETGMTPYQYLLSTRISAAKFLLKSTSVSIKEIACRCGFTSSSGFCTAFKKWENLTPKEYRDKT